MVKVSLKSDRIFMVKFKFLFYFFIFNKKRRGKNISTSFERRRKWWVQAFSSRFAQNNNHGQEIHLTVKVFFIQSSQANIVQLHIVIVERCQRDETNKLVERLRIVEQQQLKAQQANQKPVYEFRVLFHRQLGRSER